MDLIYQEALTALLHLHCHYFFSHSYLRGTMEVLGVNNLSTFSSPSHLTFAPLNLNPSHSAVQP